ncbi:hypothetical protein SDC9_120098 [bioreactor metagenome]|uniref:Uncharacterized protein n=1 Tax=bioreactor metagenome TaxID=1076179 RepID=A0A645C623_9ZZZZ
MVQKNLYSNFHIILIKVKLLYRLPKYLLLSSQLLGIFISLDVYFIRYSANNNFTHSQDIYGISVETLRPYFRVYTSDILYKINK